MGWKVRWKLVFVVLSCEKKKIDLIAEEIVVINTTSWIRYTTYFFVSLTRIFFFVVHDIVFSPVVFVFYRGVFLISTVLFVVGGVVLFFLIYTFFAVFFVTQTFFAFVFFSNRTFFAVFSSFLSSTYNVFFGVCLSCPIVAFFFSFS